jgi:hypothetical protein
MNKIKIKRNKKERDAGKGKCKHSPIVPVFCVDIDDISTF